MRKSPVEFVKGKHTGLEIPAHEEIVIEGEVPPPDKESHDEGPFGEFTGYYGQDITSRPIIKIKSIMFRNNPMIQGDPPLRPPYGHFGLPIINAPSVWNKLELAGIPGITGVYPLLAAGGTQALVVSIKQLYAVNVRQVALAATSAVTTICRFVIIVDEDIEASDPNDVIWALATRCEPFESIEISKDRMSMSIDPRISPEEKANGNYTTRVAMINACRPFGWFKEYHMISTSSYC